MSRVKKGQKYMNVSHNPNFNYGPSKIVRTKGEHADYHKARTLTDWLFIKYDMSYKSFTRKSKERKDALRNEFHEDTGVYVNRSMREESEALDILYEIGVPFAPDGTRSAYSASNTCIRTGMAI